LPTQLIDYLPPDDMDDVIETMQPMYVAILKAIHSCLPDGMSPENAVSSAMAALVKVTAAVIDDAFGLEQAKDVLNKFCNATMSCIEVYNQEVEGVE
jgi:hypothetical protein